MWLGAPYRSREWQYEADYPRWTRKSPDRATPQSCFMAAPGRFCENSPFDFAHHSQNSSRSKALHLLSLMYQHCFQTGDPHEMDGSHYCPGNRRCLLPDGRQTTGRHPYAGRISPLPGRLLRQVRGRQGRWPLLAKQACRQDHAVGIKPRLTVNALTHVFGSYLFLK